MVHGRTPYILRVILLALLLGAQTLGHVHAADHATLPGKTHCAVCPVFQQAGHAVVDCGEAPAASAVYRSWAPAHIPLTGYRLARSPNARSPPA
jgi:hypothetical protein